MLAPLYVLSGRENRKETICRALLVVQWGETEYSACAFLIPGVLCAEHGDSQVMALQEENISEHKLNQ